MATALDSLNTSATKSARTGQYIMALDEGTTSLRAVLIDEFGVIVAAAQQPLDIFYPQPGWVEQDPMEILASQVAAMAEVQFKSGIHSDQIAAVGITNQRETTIVWDRATGQPIYRAIGWQCRRTASDFDELLQEHPGLPELVQSKTGLNVDPYFSASKLRWILNNVEGAREMADAGQLMFGTIDTWLIYNLTGGHVFATDYTNASRTMLFNIHTLEWDDELLEIFDVPRSMLPEARWSSGDFGYVGSEVMTHMPPITGVVGDQQASLFGHCCFEAGQAKNTYGTGSFMLLNTGDKAVTSKNGLLTTIGIAEGGRVQYALEGSIFHTGSITKWLRDNMGLIEDINQLAPMAISAGSNNGCYMVPAFTGLGAPWWDPEARAVICGLTSASTRKTVVRAACEAIAYQVYDVLQAMKADAGVDLDMLAVDGGVSRNEFIMQFQADILGIPVKPSDSVENTALGAAYLAGLAVDYWTHEELLQNHSHSKTRPYQPSMDAETVEQNLAGWHEAILRSRSDI